MGVAVKCSQYMFSNLAAQKVKQNKNLEVFLWQLPNFCRLEKESLNVVFYFPVSPWMSGRLQHFIDKQIYDFFNDYERVFIETASNQLQDVLMRLFLRVCCLLIGINILFLSWKTLNGKTHFLPCSSCKYHHDLDARLWLSKAVLRIDSHGLLLTEFYLLNYSCSYCLSLYVFSKRSTISSIITEYNCHELRVSLQPDMFQPVRFSFISLASVDEFLVCFFSLLIGLSLSCALLASNPKGKVKTNSWSKKWLKSTCISQRKLQNWILELILW